MREQLQSRLLTLKKEHEAGERMLAELEARQRNLRDTLLRISGAIQVVEEMLAQGEASEAPALAGNGLSGLANGVS